MVAMTRKRKEEITDLCHQGHIGVRNTFKKLRDLSIERLCSNMWKKRERLMGLLLMLIDSQIKYS